MSRRILMGQKGGAYGMWVSRPGVDVLSAGDDDMLMSSSRDGMQIVASGVIVSPGTNTSVDVVVPDLGYFPLVLISGAYLCDYTFPAAGMMRIYTYTFLYGAANPVVTWAMTNQRIWH